MKLLLVKTSSLGDLLHTLPALRDLARHRPEVRVHWVVEESFQQIPTWSEPVERVIPVAWRQWRRTLWTSWRNHAIQEFLHTLRAETYDQILDAQGLFKSAIMARLARGTLHGPDRHSAREPWATLLYQHTHRVPVERHAVERLRLLFASALDLPTPHGTADFGLDPQRLRPPPESRTDSNHLLFLHGTTWESKLWPETHWYALARLAHQAGLTIELPWGNAEELRRAQAIRDAAPPDACRILPRSTLEQLAARLAGARAVIATDTGPAHLASALAIPTIALYGPTPTERIGIVGPKAFRLIGACPLAPCRQRICPLTTHRNACMHSLTPTEVWNTVLEVIS
ncbi:MAG: lipopolysaccharide heptosyltransferase I [Magnetococcales bacterium]|nr:lipopolysaccharide heptosyltransferase I [Magnetococcales bacterium]